MRAAATYLLGEHDFSAFQTQGSPRKSTVRVVYDATVEKVSLSEALSFPKLDARRSRCALPLKENRGGLEPPALIAFEIEADGFLYNMVRAIVGTLILFGQPHRGFESPSKMKDILESADRRLAGPTAPAHGLYMIDVVYPDEIAERF